MDTRLLKALLPAAAWLALSLYGFLFVKPEDLEFGFLLSPNFNYFSTHILDKIIHVLVFFILAWLILKAWMAIGRRPPFWPIFLTLVLYGGIVEISQGLMGLGRSADPLDVIADAAGVGLAFLLYGSYAEARRSKNERRRGKAGDGSGE